MTRGGILSAERRSELTLMFGYSLLNAATIGWTSSSANVVYHVTDPSLAAASARAAGASASSDEDFCGCFLPPPLLELQAVTVSAIALSAATATYSLRLALITSFPSDEGWIYASRVVPGVTFHDGTAVWQ